MSTREPRPDALVIGAPKAGTSALHAALARHDQVHASAVKEPKYYLCGDAPPPAYCGPGDAHSQQEWVWRRQDYLSLFAPAPDGTVRLESTPFYLYLPDARRRIAEDSDDVRLVAIIRDPVDRAYSNWMHLWVDGLEPKADFCEAWRAEEERIDAGWAPFWHYQRMGRYGEQLADLFTRVDRDRVLVLRYRELVAEPARTLDRVSTFLGIETGRVGVVPPDNSRPFVEPGLKAAVLGRVVRAGAVAGSYVRPELWREAVKPLYRALQHGGPEGRPKLALQVRAELVKECLDDIGLLEEVLKESFEDWRSSAGRGSFKERTS
ncbi:hypothetical protein GCM10022204_43040 [Microlunatus aurantiacus]|uniref:Sulfotransferase family protein n=1 Tax=Microlunatus aurantiacus TaxID=446786 RepID=A0ABP7EGZ3_9ACTN